MSKEAGRRCSASSCMQDRQAGNHGFGARSVSDPRSHAGALERSGKIANRFLTSIAEESARPLTGRWATRRRYPYRIFLVLLHANQDIRGKGPILGLVLLVKPFAPDALLSHRCSRVRNRHDWTTALHSN